MILTITNTSSTDYSANGVSLDAGKTLIVPEHHLNDIQFTNDTHRVTYLSTTQNYFNPFVAGTAGAVPEFDLEGSAAEKLFVALVDSISAVIVDTTDLISNRGR